MITRRVLFGPLELAYVRGWSKAFDVTGQLLQLPVTDPREILFTTLIQAGADKIETVTDLAEQLPNLSFFRDRIEASHRPEWCQSFLLTHAVFSQSLDSLDPDSEPGATLGSLRDFITELIYAMHRGQPVAIAHPFPQINLLEGSIPPRLFLPLKNLFAAFHVVKPTVVTPQITMETRNIAVFQELLSTQLFNDYKKSHDSLSNDRIDTQLASEHIRIATTPLCKKARRLLRPRNISVFLLPLVSKAIGAFFGTLPAAVADKGRHLIEPLLDRNKRIVVYQLDSILQDTWDAYIRTSEFRGR